MKSWDGQIHFSLAMWFKIFLLCSNLSKVTG